VSRDLLAELGVLFGVHHLLVLSVHDPIRLIANLTAVIATADRSVLHGTGQTQQFKAPRVKGQVIMPHLIAAALTDVAGAEHITVIIYGGLVVLAVLADVLG